MDEERRDVGPAAPGTPREARTEPHDLGELEIQEPAAPLDLPPPRRWPLRLAIVAVLLLLGAGLYLYLQRPAAKPAVPAAAGERAAAAPAPAATEPAAEAEVELPPLGASDPLVAQLVGELSAHPRIARWLGADELIRRFVASVDNIAEGVSPRTHLLFLDPEGSFQAEERDGQLYLDARSYRRYDLVTEVFVSLDTAGAASVYRTLRPLLEEAYRDLGYPGGGFDRTLARAIDRLLATPVVEGEVELAPRVTTYEFADPALENLPPAQKQLLRTGPRNVRRIKAKLGELRTALGLPAG